MQLYELLSNDYHTNRTSLEAKLHELQVSRTEGNDSPSDEEVNILNALEQINEFWEDIGGEALEAAEIRVNEVRETNNNDPAAYEELSDAKEQFAANILEWMKQQEVTHSAESTQPSPSDVFDDDHLPMQPIDVAHIREILAVEGYQYLDDPYSIPASSLTKMSVENAYKNHSLDMKEVAEELAKLANKLQKKLDEQQNKAKPVEEIVVSDRRITTFGRSVLDKVRS